METDLTLPLAFLAGLAGAGHCWAMCGGLVGGAFLGLGGGHPACATAVPRQVPPHLAYHGGRVLAYTLLGALAAGIGQAIVLTGGIGRAQGVLYVVAGVGVVLAGALAMRRSVGCPAARTEECGSVRAAHPTSRPVPPLFAVAGFLNGLMPCALVFSLTLKAATAPSIATGATWLFAFGLGTVPAMLLAGVLAHWLGAQALLWLRRAGGLLIMTLGLQAIWAGAKFFHVMLHL
ncbi:MAG: sulfite exporter TauE/SafE family protein [Pseudomonadota bacterium]|nr:sulfite exporter TauE/SafE family protein [Pseudomonadota bacterium]MDP1904353.1 sulfite exporter TauE/SafE family protein [Pseudomonadota bacterium]MDP2353506.1 sulfite exporter TauE/SafE family protein [Pseudomonadota bacterium]